MILRYLLFATMVIISTVVAMTLVKDTGETRKKLEKRLKLDSSNNNMKISLEALPQSNRPTNRPKPKTNSQNRKNRQE